jgi:hypothetical protein
MREGLKNFTFLFLETFSCFQKKKLSFLYLLKNLFEKELSSISNSIFKFVGFLWLLQCVKNMWVNAFFLKRGEICLRLIEKTKKRTVFFCFKLFVFQCIGKGASRERRASNWTCEILLRSQNKTNFCAFLQKVSLLKKTKTSFFFFLWVWVAWENWEMEKKFLNSLFNFSNNSQ